MPWDTLLSGIRTQTNRAMMTHVEEVRKRHNSEPARTHGKANSDVLVAIDDARTTAYHCHSCQRLTSALRDARLALVMANAQIATLKAGMTR